MAVYLIANYQIDDEEGIQKYREAVIPQLIKAGCEFLVINDNVEFAEGSSAPSLVILKFESREAALNWYSSDEYRSIIHLRHDSTSQGWAAISDEFVMPA